jgi:hypothetical protein
MIDPSSVKPKPEFLSFLDTIQLVDTADRAGRFFLPQAPLWRLYWLSQPKPKPPTPPSLSCVTPPPRKRPAPAPAAVVDDDQDDDSDGEALVDPKFLCPSCDSDMSKMYGCNISQRTCPNCYKTRAAPKPVAISDQISVHLSAFITPLRYYFYQKIKETLPPLSERRFVFPFFAPQALDKLCKVLDLPQPRDIGTTARTHFDKN